MKLSKAQIIIIEKIRSGVDFYYSPMTSASSCTECDYGRDGIPVSLKSMLKLESTALINKKKVGRYNNAKNVVFRHF